MSEMEDEKSWTYGRLPEYLWIGLLLNQYGREQELQKLYKIIVKLHTLAPDMRAPRMSDILSLDVTIQANFYKQIIETASKETLAPLTLIFTLSKAACRHLADLRFLRRPLSAEGRPHQLL